MLDTSFSTHKEELEFLQKQGFPINPLNSEAYSTKDIWQRAQELEKKRNELNYPIDGLVVKLNNNLLVDRLGVVGKTNRAWCAIKFKTEEVTTKLIGITWQVGRTGRVTPVAELEPIEILGTVVRRATLHNYKEFLDRNLKLNDIMVIRKAGDIIPEVLHVIKNIRKKDAKTFDHPLECPSCNTKLIKSETGVDLICPNVETCPAQVIGRLSYFSKRTLGNIEGLSDKIIQKFFEEFGIKDIPDLFDLPYQKIKTLEGFGEKSVENLKKSIDKARTIEDYKFLAALGIEGIGPEVAKLILKKINSDK